jgi:hypothetical protein
MSLGEVEFDFLKYLSGKQYAARASGRSVSLERTYSCKIRNSKFMLCRRGARNNKRTGKGPDNAGMMFHKDEHDTLSREILLQRR